MLTPGNTQLEASKMAAEAAVILAGLGFTPEMQAKPFTSLSGGWRSRCLLATSLLVKSDVLLLDEPSNFLVRCGRLRRLIPAHKPCDTGLGRYALARALPRLV